MEKPIGQESGQNDRTDDFEEDRKTRKKCDPQPDVQVIS